MLKKYIHLLFVFFLPGLHVQAQQAKEDILKINEAYKKFRDLSMNITYEVYLRQTDRLPYETTVGFFRQHEDLRYSKLQEIESLQNQDYLVVADNESKRIIVGNPVPFHPGKITLMSLDSALAICSAVTYLPGETQAGYRMQFGKTVISEFDRIELYFNKKTHLVEKLFFFYRRKMQLTTDDSESGCPKLEISFSKFDFSKQDDAAFFSESRFIRKNKEGYAAVAAYSGYAVINQKLRR